MTFEEIKTAALNADRKLLKGVNPLMFTGNKLEAGKISYDSLVLQDPNSTLADKKIDKCVAKILESITEKLVKPWVRFDESRF